MSRQSSRGAARWPSISVIITSFNQGRYIERTILSILKQDYPGRVEVIVSDGGSRDETVSVLERYPQLIWWSKPDDGFVDAVNKGLRVANGEVLAIQSSDDYYLKNTFSMAVAALMKHRDAAIVTGCDIHMQPDMKTISFSALDSHWITPRSLLFDRVIPQHCAFFRRTILDKVGGLRPEVDICADIDLWYRALHYFRGRFIPRYLGVYQLHSEQRTQVSDRWFTGLTTMVESCEKDPMYGPRFSLTEQDKRDLYIRWEVELGLRRLEPDRALERIREAMSAPNITEETRRYLARMSGRYTRKTFAEKVLVSLADGSFARRSLSSARRALLRPDVAWYVR
jgi:glycosyltransferase involved in cell wall biosynthesis